MKAFIVLGIVVSITVACSSAPSDKSSEPPAHNHSVQQLSNSQHTTVQHQPLLTEYNVENLAAILSRSTPLDLDQAPELSTNFTDLSPVVSHRDSDIVVSIDNGMPFLSIFDSNNNQAEQSIPLLNLQYIHGVSLNESHDSVVIFGGHNPYNCPIGAQCKPHPFSHLNPVTRLLWFSFNGNIDSTHFNKLDVEGLLLGATQTETHHLLVSQFTPIIQTTWAWQDNEANARTEMLSLAEPQDIFPSMTTRGLDNLLSDTCFASVNADNIQLGTVTNVTLLSKEDGSISDSLCILDEITELYLENGVLSMTNAQQIKQQFDIVDGSVLYLGH